MNILVEYETEDAFVGEEYEGISRASLYHRIFDIMGMTGFQKLIVTVKEGPFVNGGKHGKGPLTH